VITAIAAADPDYPISYVSGTLTIAPTPLVITADNKQMVYGGALPELTFGYQGLVNGDLAVARASELATVPATSHAGSYPITAIRGGDPTIRSATFRGR